MWAVAHKENNMSHPGNDWLAEKELEEYEEKHMTPHIETDEEYAQRIASINMEGMEYEENDG